MTRPKTTIGCTCAGLLFALTGYGAAATAQPAAGAAEPPAAAQPNPAENPTLQPNAAAPRTPQSPFGAAPGVFPGISPAPAGPAAPQSPFGVQPGVFPGLSPPATAAGPEQPATGVFPGLAPNPTGGPPQSPSPSGAAGPLPAAPPLLTNPGNAFGTPLPPVPTGTLLGGQPAPPSAPSFTTLGLLRSGATPIQAYDLRAPPIIIQPSIGVSGAYTDNPRNSVNTQSDVFAHLTTATNVSVDTMRVQGQLVSTLDYLKYARSSDLDTLDLGLTAFGLGTVVPDHIFVDGRASITQLSQVGGIGFASPTLVPTSQQTQATTVSLSPIARTSFGDLADAELRYNFGTESFGQGGLLNNTTATAPAAPVPGTTPSNSTQNAVTARVATGRAFSRFGSMLTLSGTSVDSQSAAKSTQLRGFIDSEYQVDREFAALARLGFEDIRYPLQPAATTSGPIWLIGGRLTPFPGSYLVLRYGRQSGFYGMSGAARYDLTPQTSVTVSYQRNLSSTEDSLLNNLNTSQLDANGTLVNQFTGLPSALANPEFAFSTTAIYRSTEARITLQTTIDRDTFGVFGFFDRRIRLGSTPGVSGVAAVLAGDDTAIGANINWSRSLTPSLSSSAALGYVTESIGHRGTLTANLSLSYLISERLSAVLHYQFINVDSDMIGSGLVASYRRNQIEIGVRRSF